MELCEHKAPFANADCEWAWKELSDLGKEGEMLYRAVAIVGQRKFTRSRE